MNNQHVREIAEAAFKARFGDIGILSINVKPGFDHYDDPMVDVRIIYDAEVERLIAPDKVPDMVKVQSEIIDKVWRDAEDSPGWPHLQVRPRGGGGAGHGVTGRRPSRGR